jgi:hypothetical protein
MPAGAMGVSKIATEMPLRVLTYNLTRVLDVGGVEKTNGRIAA